MYRKIRRNLAIGVAVAAAAAFGAGAYAATQDSGVSSRQAFLNDVAKRLKVSPKELNAALDGALMDQLQAAVAAGKLTQAQANAIEQRFEERGVAPVGPLPFIAPRSPGLFGGRAFGNRAFGPMATAAKYLGLSAAQLRQQLSSGKTLAEIATAQKKTVAGLEAALIAGEKVRLDKAVASKRISGAQEKQLLSRLSAAIEALVTGKPPQLPLGPRFAPRRFFAPRGTGTPPPMPAVPGPPPGAGTRPPMPAVPGPVY